MQRDRAMKFSVVNLGCKVNRVESDSLSAALVAAGGSHEGLADADLIVVNTCTVTADADKKTRKAVRRALRSNAGAPVVVTGCAAAINPDEFTAMSTRVVVVPKSELIDHALSFQREFQSAYEVEGERERAAEETVEKAAGKASDKTAEEAAGRAVDQATDEATEEADDKATSSSAEEAAAKAPAPPILRCGDGFHTRVGVKVQDGCNNACTYCIVHTARGRATSRALDEVLAECTAYAQAGVQEIVLTGINLGSYRVEDHRARNLNSSKSPVIRLDGLLRALLEATRTLTAHTAANHSTTSCSRSSHASTQPPVRFRISSIEPRDVDDALIELLASSDGRICRHLHLPLQSGSSRVLREMARPYDADYFRELVQRMRRRVPELSLSTDIIVGFPGETQEDFEQSCELVKACGFSKLHVFPYSRREGTPAAARSDQIDPQIKAQRVEQMIALGEKLRAEDYARRVGSRERVVVEARGCGMTESYYSIPLPETLPIGSSFILELPSCRNDSPHMLELDHD